MPKIIDPDSLNQNVEVKFNPTTLKIQLNVSGNLDDIDNAAQNGVSFQTLYSWTKEEWRTDPELIKFPFPILSITKNQFELQNGWDFSGSDSGSTFKGRLLRDGGWARRDEGQTIQEEFMNITTLGTFVTQSDQAYYQLSSSDAQPSNFLFAGTVNEPVKTFGATGAGNFDYRQYFKIFLRERAKTFSFGDLIVDQLVSALETTKYGVPLTNTTDIKITATDDEITGSAPYVNITSEFMSGSGFGNWILATPFVSGAVVHSTSSDRWFYTIAGGTSAGNDSDLGGGSDSNIIWTPYLGERLIGSNWYAYNKIIAGNSATAEEIYEKIQLILRTGSDANTGDPYVTGSTALEMLNFIGDTLRTEPGVYVDAFQAADTNRIEFTDVSDTVRTFPFVAAGTINFNTNLQNDPSSSYWMFFTTASTNLYGTTNAVLVNDNAGDPITGSVGGATSYAFDFDYDNNVQGGRASASDAPVTVVALGLATAQFVSAEGTIARSVSNSITLVSNLERNYNNPG